MTCDLGMNFCMVHNHDLEFSANREGNYIGLFNPQTKMILFAFLLLFFLPQMVRFSQVFEELMFTVLQ